MANAAPIQPGHDYVLYWMTAFRRTRWNFSLQHAIGLAKELDKPLVILEALRVGYRWASDRLHHFVIQGMADNQKRLADLPVLYYPYVEPEPQAGEGMLETLAERACAVVTDDFPCFFLPAMIRLAARRLDVRLDVVDSNGLLPMRDAPQVFSRAFSFRRHLQKTLPPHLAEFPAANPFAYVKLPTLDKLPKAITARWPQTDVAKLAQDPAALAEFPIDHGVHPSAIPGGTTAAEKRLTHFLEDKLDRYAEERNEPDRDAASGLSPYLHFGQISAHEIFHRAAEREEWTTKRLAAKPNGSREGWWNASPALESFLDELITWRELGYNLCWQQRDYDRYESLPDWAQATLHKHARDPREHIYSPEEFEHAQTHDELWNAAQRELVREGRMHNYLRMLWGKKILEWSATPRDALAVMIELNNKYALDGRNPNSYSGIFWVLGRYDRAWGPERRIFGTIRYMSSENTARKLNVKQYLRWTFRCAANRVAEQSAF
jgi:deoxyribodipyrimidine photo-lyase